jgi:N utilization substance protein A
MTSVVRHIMNGELLTVIDNLEREKGIDKEVLIQAVEAALASASRKQLGHYSDLTFSVNRETGQIRAFAAKLVTQEVSDPSKEISPDEAKGINSDLSVGDKCQVEIPPKSFGRIAAQTARQVVIQKIREAEREVIYREFEGKQGDTVNGAVCRFEQGNVILDLGKTEAILPTRERVPGEEFQIGFRLRAYILEVNKGDAPAQIVVSRSHPGLVRKLFELEVPEIYEGTIEIKAVAREPGERTKVAVVSLMENVDPVGACVGMRGSRIKNIVRELREEKIDIVPWDKETTAFITNALSPAKVLDVKINEKDNTADVTVGDDQLSLAIGKKGQNVRLAARLTGWKINVRTGAKLRAEESAKELQKLPGVGMKLAWDLVQAGFNSVPGLASADVESLMEVPGVGKKTAEKLLKAAKEEES